MNKLLSVIVILCIIFSSLVSAEGASRKRKTTGSAEQISQLLIPLSGLIDKSKVITFDLIVVKSILFSPDGQLLASISDDKVVTLWDAKKGQKKFASAVFAKPVSALAFSHNSRLLAVACGNTITVLDTATGEQKLTMKGKLFEYDALAFSPNDQTLASGGYRGKGGSIVLWDTLTGNELSIMEGHPKQVTILIFLPDNNSLLSLGGQSMLLWDLETKTVRYSRENLSGAIVSALLQPDGHSVITGGDNGIITFWNLESRQAEMILTVQGNDEAAVHPLIFNADGRVLGYADKDKNITLWDIRNNKSIITVEGHTKLSSPVAFSPDNRTAVIAGKTSMIFYEHIDLYLNLSSAPNNAGMVDALKKEMEEKIGSLLAPKDEFEKTAEYDVRIKNAAKEKELIRIVYERKIRELNAQLATQLEEKRREQYPFSHILAENKYDADREEFQATLFETNIAIPVPREQARAIRNSKMPMIITGRLRYYDSQYAVLTEGMLLNAEGQPEFRLSLQKR